MSGRKICLLSEKFGGGDFNEANSEWRSRCCRSCGRMCLVCHCPGSPRDFIRLFHFYCSHSLCAEAHQEACCVSPPSPLTCPLSPLCIHSGAPGSNWCLLHGQVLLNPSLQHITNWCIFEVDLPTHTHTHTNMWTLTGWTCPVTFCSDQTWHEATGFFVPQRRAIHK